LSTENAEWTEASPRRPSRWLESLWALPRCIVGAALLLSSVPKMLRPDEFFRAVMAYRLTTLAVAKATAMYLPYLEILLGVLLIAGTWVMAAASWATLLLAAFVVLQCVTLWRGLEVACGCFSVWGEGALGWVTVARTCLLLGLAALALEISRRRRHPLVTGPARKTLGVV